MNLRQLEYFVTVADIGSFSRAAVILNMAQPSLSRQIALLEADVEQRLFERTGRGVSLTSAGLVLLDHARALLNSASKAKHELKEMTTDPSGKIVLGLPNRVAAGLAAPLVRDFRRALPNAMLTIVEGLSLSLQESLINGRIDLALLFDPSPTPLLFYEQIMRERLMLFVPSFYRVAEQVDLQSLSQYPLVLPAAPNPIRSLVEAILFPMKIKLDVVAEVGAIQSALSVVEAGVACSILPESAIYLGHKAEAVKMVSIVQPTMWNMLVLAQSRARPSSRLQKETVKLLHNLDFRRPRGE